MKKRKIALLFPGQGAQYPGMAADFVREFPEARHTFEEADDCLGSKLSNIILHGPEDLLKQTKNCQTGIFTVSIAILRVLQRLYPELSPSFCSGHSLGEYSAIAASRLLTFQETLSLVQWRGQYMNDACEASAGAMAVILGLNAEDVEEIVRDVDMPNDLWAANFNCPGQVVISGTSRGIEAGTLAAKARGAKRILSLQVHGAFHSGLMRSAEERLAPHIEKASFQDSPVFLVMNAVGAEVKEIPLIKKNLIKQVTHSVRWEQGIRFLCTQGVELFIELGCGKTLSGFNKRIGVAVPTLSIEKTEDLGVFERGVNNS